MKYIDKLNEKLLNGYELSLYEYGINHNVPIMELDGIAHIVNLIRSKKITKVLEIGCAISFSAHMYCFAGAKYVDTVERDLHMIDKAKQFIKNGPYKENIHLIEGDALELDLSNFQTDYDLIVFDAAKVQNIKFFEKYSPLLNKGGLIITDNILFHGCVENPVNLSKNVFHMVNKIKEYCTYLQNREDFDTVFLQVGDGQAVSYKK